MTRELRWYTKKYLFNRKGGSNGVREENRHKIFRN
jgi:hypothetical protein